MIELEKLEPFGNGTFEPQKCHYPKFSDIFVLLKLCRAKLCVKSLDGAPDPRDGRSNG
jgi:hypothetical protein